jgi:hypothetical protein
LFNGLFHGLDRSKLPCANKETGAKAAISNAQQIICSALVDQGLCSGRFLHACKIKETAF